MGRIFDLTLTFLALMILSPLMALIALLIRVSMGTPILFTQTRPGFNTRPFRLFKFRTMKDLRDENDKPLSDADRLTSLGRFLRSTSLDELPGLFNVLKGDMSIVGPRPLLMKYLDRYTDEQMRRHEVKPGLTGWAQVNGRNGITWNEKFRLDVWYVDHQSLWLDLRIVGMTVLKVMRREGICQEGHATMEEYDPQITQILAD